MLTGFPSESYRRMEVMEDRWKMMYHEHQRAPTYSVPHYITYLRRFVAATVHGRVAGAPTDKIDRKAVTMANGRPSDSITPMSYFIRKLKLDLKMAYQSFVREFVQPPNNGLRLLLTLLKNLLCQSANPVGGSVPKSAGLATLRMEEYKKTMVDEHDCLLCIKYTLRVMHAREELIEDNSGLLTVASCLLSNFSKSRVTALEILSLLLTGPSSVDKVLDAFTSMRIKHAESTRFKMLIGMMYIKGAPNVIFQVSCLRLLNSLLNLCRSANMRVFLQYEMEEAGLDCNRLQENCQGDGLEFDDLRKEIREWKSRYIDVSCLLRKIRSDMRAEGNNVAVTEFNYDQQFGSMYSAPVTELDPWRGDLVEYNQWMGRVQNRQQDGASSDQANNISPVQVPQPDYFSDRPVTSHSTSDLLQVGVNHLSTSLPLPSPSSDGHYDVISSIPESHRPPQRLNNSFSDMRSHGLSESRDMGLPSEEYSVVRHANPSHMQNGQKVNVRNVDQNWTLAQKPGADPAGSRVDSGKQNGQFDSGISVNFSEHASVNNEHNPQNNQRRADHNQRNEHARDQGLFEARNLFFTGETRNPEAPKVHNRSFDFGVKSNPRFDSGPLKWYNPGIHPSQHQGNVSSNDRAGASSYSQNLERRLWEQDRPSAFSKPTRLKTPPPDYNTEDTPKPNVSRRMSLLSASRAEERGGPKRSQSTPWHGIKIELNGSEVPESMLVSGSNEPNLSASLNSLTENNLQENGTHNHHHDTRTNFSSDRFKAAASPSNDNTGGHSSPTHLSQPKPYPNMSPKSSRPAVLRSPTAISSEKIGEAKGAGFQRTSTSQTASQEVHKKSSNGTSPSSNIYRNGNIKPGQQLLNNSSSKTGDQQQLQQNKQNHHEQNGQPRLPPQRMPQNEHHTTQRLYPDVSLIEKQNAEGSKAKDTPKAKTASESKEKADAAALNETRDSNLRPPKAGSKEAEPLNGADSMRSYSAEIGKVLNDLDQTLESHGWRASLKSHMKPQRPLIAYV